MKINLVKIEASLIFREKHICNIYIKDCEQKKLID